MSAATLCVRRTHKKRKAVTRVVPLAPGDPRPAGIGPAAETAQFHAEAGQACEWFGPKRRMLLVGLGAAREAERAGALAAARLSGEARIVLDLRRLPPAEAAALATGAAMRAWRFGMRGRPEKEEEEEDAPRLRRIERLAAPGAGPAWRQAKAALSGALFARELVAEPSNVLTPADFCTRLRALEAHGIELTVLKPPAMQREGLGGLLAVGRAAAHGPRLAVLRWPGRGKRATDAQPVAFVGKGITFDTGGVSIKPAHGMWEMRADMGGAAACAGAMLALARRRSPAPAVAVLPLAENAVGPASYRPSDVLRLCDGSTVEVVDTDAEGRLVLADALAWTVKTFKPQAVIDLATLTGSIVTAVGPAMGGLFDNDAALAAQVAAAGQAVGEPVWRMPIGESHRAAINSDIADLRHCSPQRYQPDACIAAAFLREFVGDTPWAHLDIAGMELRDTASDRHAAGATGFGARLLDRLVTLRFEDPHRL